MASKKQITWFFSKTGRQFAYGAACFSCVTSIACLYTPQTFALSKYIDIVHLYKDGIKADLPSQVKQTFDKCVAMVENSELKKNVLNPFVVFGYDLFHAGTTKSKFGISIGIPDNFKYKSEEDVDKDDIQVNNKPVEWNSDPGQKLSDALVLPENVQMFGICREILMAQTNKMYYDSFSPGMIIFMSYATASRINQNLNLHLKPASFRFVMYGLIGLFAVGSYFLIKDVTQVHFEGKIDAKLADFGPEMTRSGIEFYTKMMNRNVALRYFLGEEGEKLYSATGNENFFIRNKRMPLHMRKQYFEQRLSKYLAEKEEIEQPPSEKR